MKQKPLKLVRFLLEQPHSITANTLAIHMGVSVRSVKSYIHDINVDFPEAIQSSRNGYEINSKTAKFIIENSETHIPQSSEERIVYIMNSLIKYDEEINSYDLCDEMYISISTLKNELQKVKRKLKKFSLELFINKDFLSIKGLEKNKRKLLSTILYNESNVNFVNLKTIQNAFIDIDIEFIKNTVVHIFNEYHYFINDYSLINLVLHITIAIDRIRNDNINPNENLIAPNVKIHEYELAQKVVTVLEKHFNIKYSDSEIYELILLLISRVTAIDYKSINTTNLDTFIGKETLDLVETLIQSVNNFYYIDLSEPEFKIRFALHIRNLLIRSKNNYFNKNPLTDSIKTSCPLIYDVSVHLSSIIKEKTEVTINDDEIAYIAFHLGSTLEAQKNLNTKITAVLYCPNYYDMNLRLINTINTHFASQMLITNILTDESNFDQSLNTDLIISTIPLSFISSIPFIQINVFLNEKDNTGIQNKIGEIRISKKKKIFEIHLRSLIKPTFFERKNNLNNEKDAIEYMVNKMIKLEYVDKTFKHDIFEREKLSSTAFNSFAIPHTMKMNANKTGINILISDSPILWNEKPVNLVMMLCFNKKERHIFNEIFEPITMILSDNENVRKVIQCIDYEQFINLLVSLLK